MTKGEKRLRRRQRIARDKKIQPAPNPQQHKGRTAAVLTAIDPLAALASALDRIHPTPNIGTQTMNKAPEPQTPNTETNTMKKAATNPEKSAYAIVVQVRANTHNAITGKSSSTVWSIQNPDGSYWTNKRNRRRAWGSRAAAEAMRFSEMPDAPKANHQTPRLPAPPPPPASHALPDVALPPIVRDALTHISNGEVDVPAPRDEVRVKNSAVPNPERIGKFVAAAIAIDDRLGRRIATEVMQVVTTMIRDA